MLSAIPIFVLVQGAAIAVAIGLGYALRDKPDLLRWRNSMFSRLPWHFYGAATVFFLGMSLYSMRSSLAVVYCLIHGTFAVLEAFVAGKQFGEQRARFSLATHVALPALTVGMLIAALHPVTAMFLMPISGIAGVVLMIQFFMILRSPKQAQS